MTDQLAPGANAAVSVPKLEVPLEAVPADEVVSGTPTQGIVELGSIGTAELGVWELRDGQVTDTEAEEIFIVVSGGADITFLDGPQAGETVTVSAGDAMRLVAGTKTRWSVPDHIRKVYVTA